LVPPALSLNSNGSTVPQHLFDRICRIYVISTAGTERRFVIGFPD
jgi:hypothetical protein